MLKPITADMDPMLVDLVEEWLMKLRREFRWMAVGEKCAGPEEQPDGTQKLTIYLKKV